MPTLSERQAPAGRVGQGPAMGSIAQSIYNQMSRAGQPRTTTTKVEEPIIDEPLNIGQIGLLVYALLGQSQYKPQGAAATQGGLSSDQISELFSLAGGGSAASPGVPSFSLAGNYGG